MLDYVSRFAIFRLTAVDVALKRLMIKSMIENLFNVPEVAKILKISERQVWRYIKAKDLKAIKLSPGTLRVSERDLETFIKKHKK